MAPGGASADGPRRQSGKSKGPRGGIQKRGAIGKTDRDGDLIMDGGKDNSTPKGRSNASKRTLKGGAKPRNSLASAQTQQAIIKGLNSQQVNVVQPKRQRDVVQIRVRGLEDSAAAKNKDGGLKDLLSFLERKASAMDGAPRRGVKIKKSTLQGKDVIITVSKEEADLILKLDDFTFARSKLIIEPFDNDSLTGLSKPGTNLSEHAQTIKEKIKGILASRYDIDLKLLNLSALGQDAGLIEMGMFDEEKRITKLFPALMKVCDDLFDTPQQKREAIVSVTLAGNALDSVATVSSLASTFPDIANLDLSGNKFSTLDQLEPWRWKFQKLQNLRLMDNPILTGLPNYQETLCKWYPELQILNDVQVRSPEEIAALRAKNKPIKVSPIPIQGPDFRDVGGIGEGFLKAFFPLYDNDRTNLVNTLYDAHSTVSISINTSAPRAESESQTVHRWSSYIQHSRNLFKATSESGQLSRMCQGIDQITALWRDLPATKHPNIIESADKWIMDCHAQSGLPDITGQSPVGVDGMILTVQGEFEERNNSKSNNVRRSFSRIFVLGPGSGQPGASTIRVASDVMVVRAWSPLATAEKEAIAAPTSANDTDAQRREMLQRLRVQTRMTEEYATMCLEGSNWNYDGALVAFETNKAKLPPDAFVAV